MSFLAQRPGMKVRISFHRKIGCGLLAIILALPIAASAQDHPKGELFVGFSGRNGGNPILPGWNASAAIHLNDQLAIVADFSGHYGSGSLPQSGSVTFANLQTFLLGIPSSALLANANSTQTDIYSFLAGPQYSHKINSRARVFVRALFGASRVHASAISPLVSGILGTVGPAQPNQPSITVPAPVCNAINGYFIVTPSGIATFVLNRSCDTEIGFSFGAGGGLDVTVVKHWSVRALQGDYLNKPSVLGEGRNDFRLSSGLIYQW
jgi:hypothetical protein